MGSDSSKFRKKHKKKRSVIVRQNKDSTNWVKDCRQETAFLVLILTLNIRDTGKILPVIVLRRSHCFTTYNLKEKSRCQCHFNLLQNSRSSFLGMKTYLFNVQAPLSIKFCKTFLKNGIASKRLTVSCLL